MSAFSGPYGGRADYNDPFKGMKGHKLRKRLEAEERNALTPPERRKAARKAAGR